MRLIDADALIEEMRKTEEECENAMTCPSWWSALSVIEKQPTAYNVEKVVECLEEKVELAHKRYVDCPVNSPCYERYRTQYNERRMCLDIVEGGGVNDD